MKARTWIAFAIAVLTIPVLLIGLIDLLDGGLALLVALIAALALAVVAIGIALLMMPPSGGAGPDTSAPNPLRGPAGVTAST